MQQSHVTEGRISTNKNIKKAFGKGKAFIPFITRGDPSLAVTERIVYAMEEAGADLIELGIPFSDSSENFYTNGFHDLCKCGILLWYRALREGGSRNRDGVIVGSAIVKLCEKYGADCVPHISTFVKEMKDAIR